MDRNIIAINRLYADQEEAAEAACYSAAANHGHSNNAAKACDERQLQCPACPFNTHESAAKD